MNSSNLSALLTILLIWSRNESLQSTMRGRHGIQYVREYVYIIYKQLIMSCLPRTVLIDVNKPLTV